jgi:hypothetical protein
MQDRPLDLLVGAIELFVFVAAGAAVVFTSIHVH